MDTKKIYLQAITAEIERGMEKILLIKQGEIKEELLTEIIKSIPAGATIQDYHVQFRQRTNHRIFQFEFMAKATPKYDVKEIEATPVVTRKGAIVVGD